MFEALGGYNIEARLPLPEGEMIGHDSSHDYNNNNNNNNTTTIFFFKKKINTKKHQKTRGMEGMMILTAIPVAWACLKTLLFRQHRHFMFLECRESISFGTEESTSPDDSAEQTDR
jgi:hypothetical protein